MRPILSPMLVDILVLISMLEIGSWSRACAICDVEHLGGEHNVFFAEAGCSSPYLGGGFCPQGQAIWCPPIRRSSCVAGSSLTPLSNLQYPNHFFVTYHYSSYMKSEMSHFSVLQLALAKRKLMSYRLWSFSILRCVSIICSLLLLVFLG